MTIKRKNIRPSGLLEVEADNTDTVDLNGFSDAIQAVGAKTAKFSGGATMQANPGLRIGMTQLKINTDAIIFTPRVRSLQQNLGYTDPDNTFDNVFTSSGNAGTVNEFIIIDFGSIAISELHIQANRSALAADSASFSIEISDDDISYSFVSNIALTTTSTDYDFGTRTWRYVKVTLTAQNNAFARLFEVFELASSPNEVTVRVRSSTSIDSANGTIIISDQVMNENETLTFVTDLLLTGNPTGDFVTLEIVSFSGLPIPVTLSEITSIKEV